MEIIKQNYYICKDVANIIQDFLCTQESVYPKKHAMLQELFCYQYHFNVHEVPFTPHILLNVIKWGQFYPTTITDEILCPELPKYKPRKTKQTFVLNNYNE